MIEAINSAVANAPIIRASGGLKLEAQAASSAQADRDVVRAPYISPYISVDVNFDAAVLQIRDAQSGDVVQQIPSPETLEQIRIREARENAEQQELARRQSVERAQETRALTSARPTIAAENTGNVAPAPQVQQSTVSQAAASASAAYTPPQASGTVVSETA